MRCPGYGRGDHEETEENFYIDKSRGNGRSALCRACHCAKNRAYYKGYYDRNRKTIIEKVILNRRLKRAINGPILQPR